MRWDLTNHQRQSRRAFLQHASGGFGLTALTGLYADTLAAQDPLAAKRAHFDAKADSVIFIYATGGVSHIDTFDYKPDLIKDHGKSITASRWLNKTGEYERF